MPAAAAIITTDLLVSVYSQSRLPTETIFIETNFLFNSRVNQIMTSGAMLVGGPESFS